jgi:ABC-type metal ion transport system substrate-binding protein
MEHEWHLILALVTNLYKVLQTLVEPVSLYLQASKSIAKLPSNSQIKAFATLIVLSSHLAQLSISKHSSSNEPEVI